MFFELGSGEIDEWFDHWELKQLIKHEEVRNDWASKFNSKIYTP